MGLILDGNSEHVAHKNIYFVTVHYLIECLKQIIKQGFFFKCAPNSELPSNKSTIWVDGYMNKEGIKDDDKV